MPTDALVISARWVFPGTAPPLEGGIVTVRDGVIAAVEPPGIRTPDLDLGNVAIIPGLVNAHTHLDLSDLQDKVPPTKNFVGWLRSIIAHRRDRNGADVSHAIHHGMIQSLRYGTTAIGDISGGGQSWSVLANSPMWAVCYRELLGLQAERVETVWRELMDWTNGRKETATCRVGVSPHAPYSVHKALIEAAARLFPICIHLAESESEQELLNHRAGEFVSFLKDLGVWDESSLAPSWDWIVWRASRSPAATLAHGNYLNTINLPTNTTVVYCPRTHEAFGHPPHPFMHMLAAGCRVALGTDSLASNPDLDVLAEARFIHAKYSDLGGDTILRMATINGADALGFGAVTGSLERGKSADLVAVPLPNAESPDPYDLLLGPLYIESPDRMTMWRGVWRP